MARNVSLKDIAKEVGVSVATVSYVLSKGKDSGVSDEVSDKVRKAARLLNYQPNLIAKSLKMGKTSSIGLIVADISNSFFSEIARNIEDEAKRYNHTVVFGSSDERAEKSWDLIQFLANRQVDGFIIAPSAGSEDQIKYLKERQIPFVLIDRFFPEIDSNYVITDNFHAAKKATELLISNGSKNIGMIAYSNELFNIKERIRGYREAVEAKGLSSWICEVDYENTEEDIRKEIKRIFDSEDIDALLFATNSLAIPGLRYINEVGLKVGEDIAVITFDQGEAFDFFYCPLTYVRQPLFEIARKATEILIDEISQGKFLKKEICMQTELVVRDSCKIKRKSLP